MQYEPIATHIYADVFGVKREVLNDGLYLLNIMTKACFKAKVTVEDIYVKFYQPEGITVQVNLSESHANCYSYPEHEYLMVDILLCGKKDPKMILDYLIEHLKPVDYKYRKEVVGKNVGR